MLRAGLPENFLATLPSTLAPSKYYRFIEAIDSELGDKDIALELYGIMSVEIFSPPTFAAVCSPNLRAAAQRVADYRPLMGPITLQPCETKTEFIIEFIEPSKFPAPATVILIELVFWLFIARYCTRSEVVPKLFEVRQLPAHIDEFERVIGIPLSEGAADRISFKREDAQLPFLSQNEVTWAAFRPELRRRLSLLDPSASIAEQVRAVLLEAIPAAHATVDFVASKLHVSVRTLQRRLRAESVSFQSLLSETRAGLSRHYLAETSLPYAEVAYLLGYRDTNSFYRAFKKWEQTTPETYRLQMCG